MTNEQLYLSIGVPMLFNAVLIGLVTAYVNAKISGIRQEVHTLRDEIHVLREDMREIRTDVKLLTGKVYEMMSKS